MRPLQPADRDTIHWIAASTGVYGSSEIDAALEVVDAALEQEERYSVFVLEDGGIPAGFVSLGPVPRTDGTWQIYAIAVEQQFRGKGLGRHLLAYAESHVRDRKGRQLLLEVSSHEVLAGAAGFYERTGYDLVARIPGYYRTGDDRLVFSKQVEPAAATVPV